MGILLCVLGHDGVRTIGRWVGGDTVVFSAWVCASGLGSLRVCGDDVFSQLTVAQRTMSAGDGVSVLRRLRIGGCTGGSEVEGSS